jgi:hypothetical protein
MSAPDLTLVSDTGVSIDTDRPILIPECEYDFLHIVTWKGYMYGGRAPKVFLTFRIVTECPYYGQHLKRYYNVKGFTRKNEIILPGWSCYLARDYGALWGRPRKLKDIGVTRFKGKVIRGTVKTVKNNFKGKPLPESLWYSRIDELTQVIAG